MKKDYTHDNLVDLDDVYHSSASSYLRLMNAYRLDKQAALQSASWGKFQIMGRITKRVGLIPLKIL